MIPVDLDTADERADEQLFLATDGQQFLRVGGSLDGAGLELDADTEGRADG